MIYAATREEIERRKAFIRKWRLKHRAVADSLEEAGDRLFSFTRLLPSQWRSARTTNAIELRIPQSARDEIVEDGALGLGALAAHALDREQHLLAVRAYAEDNGSRFDRAVGPLKRRGASADRHPGMTRAGRGVASERRHPPLRPFLIPQPLDPAPCGILIAAAGVAMDDLG